MSDFLGKVLLISGSTGIAEATARGAADRGAQVFITSRTEANCRALGESLPDAGYQAADLSEDGAAEAVVAGCVERYGRIDLLFNVAGISGRKFGDGPLHECTSQGWDTTMSVNVRSLYQLSHHALRQMLAQAPGANDRCGVILHMASVLGFSPEANHFTAHAYAASKGAILGLTKAMAAYYAAHKIRVNAIAPALVATPMSERAQQNEEILEFMKSKQPLTEGLINTDQVAEAALFLLGDGADVITGDVLTVDAGWCVS
ncbi:MAG: SDR family oxidoreductase [Candidatus Latescibacterota bacterium]|nr:SDR family oxidoreductase [Candidatus Latescibacterota bacterium]